jgi:hypothetical protein
MYKPNKPEGGPPSQQEMDQMGKFMEESFKSGVLLSAEGCMSSASGARVRLAGGKVTVTDGPFTESKELVGGFAIIQAASKKEAIEYTKQFLNIAGDGETEVRQLYEVPASEAARR